MYLTHSINNLTILEKLILWGKYTLLIHTSCFLMLTPLEDIDIFYVLPYLNTLDISCILRLKKILHPKYHEQLEQMKFRTLCDISFHTCRAFNEISKIQFVQEKRQHLEHIHCVELKKDGNSVSYLKITYTDRMHQHIIYGCKIRFDEDRMILDSK